LRDGVYLPHQLRIRRQNECWVSEPSIGTETGAPEIPHALRAAPATSAQFCISTPGRRRGRFFLKVTPRSAANSSADDSPSGAPEYQTSRTSAGPSKSQRS